MHKFSVWVDADSCPVPVKQIIFRFCEKKSIPLFFVANREIPLPKKDHFKMIICPQSQDAADNYITGVKGSIQAPEPKKKKALIPCYHVPVAGDFFNCFLHAHVFSCGA